MKMNESSPAYDALIGPLEDRMMRSIWRIVRNAHDAEDAMQNALATIWQRWDRVRRHANPQALVLRICLDAAYDVVRRRERQRVEAVNIERANTERADPARTPTDELAGRETYAEVVAALGRLPRRQATALSLRVFEGLSYEDIAAAMSCTAATARKHAERARARLRVALARHEPNPIRES